MRIDTSLASIGLLGRSVTSLSAAAPTPTPTPGPTALTKLVAEGDSITFASGSYAELWADANAGVAFANYAQVSNGIAELNARLVSMMAVEDPSHLTVLIGTNDMNGGEFATAQDYVDAVLAYVAAAKAIKPTLSVGVAGILPVSDSWWASAGFNARRAEYNSLMRAEVGAGIDFYIPLGDHPQMEDAAAEDATLFGDEVHPTAAGYAVIAPVYAAVMDSILAGAADSVPGAFTFADTGAELGTVYTSQAGPITGLGMGAAATAELSGAGEYMRGNADTGPGFGTGSLPFMNGDVVTVRHTSAVTPDTATNTVVTIGGAGDVFTTTTSSVSLTTAYRSAAAAESGWAANHTFGGVTFYAGKNIIAIGGEMSPAPSTVSLDGTEGTKIAEIGTGLNATQFWEVAKSTDGSGDLVVTCPAINSIGYVLWSTDAGAEFAGAQGLPFDYRPSPLLMPSIGMPTGGSILFFVHSEPPAHTLAAASDCTEEADFVAGSARRFWAGRRSASGQCGVTMSEDYGGQQALAIALQP
jgi:lysophospholipase L1-like esterase